MADNEFLKYSKAALYRKKKRFTRLQRALFAFTGVLLIIIVIAYFIKDNPQVFQLAPFLVISGVIMPLVIFNPILKKYKRQLIN